MPEEAARNNKRKKKKSFLKNARKYAKKGCYGRGAQLEVDTYQYLVRIMEVYKEGFENDEDKLIFVNNVFEQMDTQEIQCSCNQLGCRVVEMLLPFANDVVLKKYMEAFSADLRPLCSDRFASHVLEALIRQTCKKSLTCIDDALKNKYKEFTLKISKFLLNNLEDYIWDSYGNHIIRTGIEIMAQIPSANIKDPKLQNCVTESIPEEYTDVVNEYGDRLIKWPQFSELGKSEKTSGFLQVLLKALEKLNPKLLKKYLKRLLDENFAMKDNEIGDANKIPEAFLSTSSLMLLEVCLQVADVKTFNKIYARCFAGKCLQLAKIKSTNFAVQKLINHCQEKEQFESIFDELADNLHEIIELGFTGVVLSLGQGCKKLSTKQNNFQQSLMKSLDCLEPEERQDSFVLCLSRLTKFENLKNQNNENLDKEKLCLHGTLTLQFLLEFNKPIKVVNGILNMDVNVLKNLFSNSMGSHIVDSFVKSTFVGEKSREKLVRKLKGVYQELAASKYGSRSFEAVWAAANIKSKGAIMEELAYKDASWSNTEHGKIISSKINLKLFKRNKEEWKNSLNKKVDKVTEMFSDVLK